MDALGERADRRRLQLLVVDLVQQLLRLRHLEMIEQHRRQHGDRAAMIRRPQHRAEGRPADPVAAALVAEHVSPSPGSRRLAGPRCGRRQSSPSPR
jgi:hypothetical protein